MLTSCQDLRSNDKRTAWEYKILIGSSRDENMINEALLNKLGSEGWELVTIEAKADNYVPPAYIFKRKKD
jgi:hypothetical protein